MTLRLEGRRANRPGIGARIEAVVERPDGTSRSIHHLVGSGGSFGVSSLQAEMGLGDATTIVRLIIRWPGSGTVDVFEDVEPRRVYRAVEGAERLEPVELPRIRLGGRSGPPHHGG